MPDHDTVRSLLERQALDMREKAEEFRTAAEGLGHRPARSVLLRLADTWDQRAAMTEANAKALARTPSPRP
jgi:hypothetical protein